MAEHFVRWLDLLKPMLVVFIGKQPYDWGGAAVQSRGITFNFVNRQKSLTGLERAENQARIVRRVRELLQAR